MSKEGVDLMEDNKKTILLNKRISTILFILLGIPFTVMLVITIVFAFLPKSDIFSNLIIITGCLFIPFIGASIYRLISSLIKLEEYDYEGFKIGVYAGVSHYYLYVNGETVDQYENLLDLNSIRLIASLNDYDIEATISASKKITLKVNGEIVKAL